MSTVRGSGILLSTPAVLALIALFIIPSASLLVGGAVDPLAAYGPILRDSYYLNVIFVTFQIALLVTICSILVGYPVAYLVSRRVAPGIQRRIIYMIIIAPLLTSNVVRTFGWLILLGRNGFVNKVIIALGISDVPLQLLYTKSAIVVGLTYVMVPFMILTIVSALQNINNSLIEAAFDLGASSAGTFFRVTLPLSVPGIVAGSLIVFCASASAYVTASVLGGGKITVFSMLIYEKFSVSVDFAGGAALSALLLILTVAIAAIYLSFMSRRSVAH